MNKSGFTLVEMLIIVLIIAVLSSIAMPQYSRTIERSRASEAFGTIQQVDDAIYSYYTERQKCPTTFGQLSIAMPVSTDSSGSVTLKNFQYTLQGGTATIPDTSCKATLATRVGSKYEYTIQRSYGNATKNKTLCAQKSGAAAGQEICDMLDLSAS